MYGTARWLLKLVYSLPEKHDVAETTSEKLTKIHERIDEIYRTLSPLAEGVAEIRATCGPCKKLITAHQETLHGNGKTGIVTEVATLKTGRTDTLSVKSVCVLVGAIGSLAATIGAAMAAFAK